MEQKQYAHWVLNFSVLQGTDYTSLYFPPSDSFFYLKSFWLKVGFFPTSWEAKTVRFPGLYTPLNWHVLPWNPLIHYLSDYLFNSYFYFAVWYFCILYICYFISSPPQPLVGRGLGDHVVSCASIPNFWMDQKQIIWFIQWLTCKKLVLFLRTWSKCPKISDIWW